jgi:hypothetical protein
MKWVFAFILTIVVILLSPALAYWLRTPKPSPEIKALIAVGGAHWRDFSNPALRFVIGRASGWAIMAVYPEDVPKRTDIPPAHLSELKLQPVQFPDVATIKPPPFSIILSQPGGYWIGPIELAEREDVG